MERLGGLGRGFASETDAEVERRIVASVAVEKCDPLQRCSTHWRAFWLPAENVEPMVVGQSGGAGSAMDTTGDAVMQ